jgi:hypothetical protein
MGFSAFSSVLTSTPVPNSLMCRINANAFGALVQLNNAICFSVLYALDYHIHPLKIAARSADVAGMAAVTVRHSWQAKQ